LDKQGFSPFGVVVEGMDLVDKLYAGYGEGAPSGRGPNQGLIQAKGNAYLTESYPNLSYISKATIAK
jgi:peptidyl-prolyl cis-trans isomerase A (cyclophilin A)